MSEIYCCIIYCIYFDICILFEKIKYKKYHTLFKNPKTEFLSFITCFYFLYLYLQKYIYIYILYLYISCISHFILFRILKFNLLRIYNLKKD